MSFSSDIKKEILENFSKKINKCCIDAEKFGESITEIKHKNEVPKKYIHFFDISNINECCFKSIIKGIFLSSGCIVNPENDYHFEIVLKSKACSEYVMNLLSVLEFTPRMLKRDKANVYVIYIKEADQISLILSLLGASHAMLKFEQIRVEKNVKNNINRNINCETANLSKVIKSSVKQIEAINKIKKHNKFESLNDKLKVTANIREEYPNESLEFLAGLLSKEEKVTKSGLKHRFDKLIDIANNL